jgi:hypothetical protein
LAHQIRLHHQGPCTALVLLVAAFPDAHRQNFLRSLLMDVVTFHHLEQLMVVLIVNVHANNDRTGRVECLFIAGAISSALLIIRPFAPNASAYLT